MQDRLPLSGRFSADYTGISAFGLQKKKNGKRRFGAYKPYAFAFRSSKRGGSKRRCYFNIS